MGIKDNVIGLFNRGKFFAQANSPKICFVLGTVELAVTVVSACKATLKFKDHIDEYKARMAKLDTIAKAQEDGTATEDAAEIDVKKYRRDAKITLGLDFFKCYWKTMVLGVATTGTYYAGYRELTNRAIDAAGVAAAAMTQLKEERARIEEKYGPEGLKTAMGLSEEQATVEGHIDKETGEQVVDRVTYPEARDLFGLWFDVRHKDYDKTVGANQEFLRQKQAYLNWKLDRDKKLFVNDALRILGYDDENLFEAGQYYGWIKYKTDEEAALNGAANFVDLGVFKDHGVNKEFAEGRVREALIMLNVDPMPITSKCGYRKQGDAVDRDRLRQPDRLWLP